MPNMNGEQRIQKLKGEPATQRLHVKAWGLKGVTPRSPRRDRGLPAQGGGRDAG